MQESGFGHVYDAGEDLGQFRYSITIVNPSGYRRGRIELSVGLDYVIARRCQRDGGMLTLRIADGR